MSKVLVDTSLVIDFLRRKDKEQSLLYKISDNDLYISIITHTELYAGRSVWEKPLVKKAVEKVLSGMNILILDEKISQKAGYLKVNHHTVSLSDCIIAATALEYILELSTLNRRDFENIKSIKLFSKDSSSS